MYTKKSLNIIFKRRVINLFTLTTILFALITGLTSCNKEDDNLPLENSNTKNALITAHVLTSGLQGTTGSVVGPDGNLYVPQGALGTISSIDPKSGNVTEFASGLPPLLPAIGIGGAIDVAFRNGTAYALVTLVGEDVGGNDTVGIYRIDGNNSYTIIADIGQFNNANPPETDFFIPSGVQYAIETYRDGFLVTDGHLNRVLFVTVDGDITIVRSFENIVPTGLALSGNKIYMAESGPVPHHPEDGKVISFVPSSPKVKTVAYGAPMLVDAEFGFANRLFALSQGIWDGVGPGSPAEPNTGSLVRANSDGTFTIISDELDRPTSLELIDNTAYIVTLTGDVLVIEKVNSPPYGN